MSADDNRWPLEKVIEETRKGLQELALLGAFPEEEPDLSYLTQELLDSYWNEAQEKDEALVQQETASNNNVACYWGNNWALISKNKWAYTNSHSGRGCDPVKESVLCGSGYRWKVTISTISGRHCRNGAKNAKMAWR